MRKLLSLPPLLVLLLVLASGVYWCYSPSGVMLRNQYYSTPPEFQKLLKRFQRQQIQYEETSAALPLIYAQQDPKGFSIAIAERPLNLRKSQVSLRNPFAAGSYPLSGSVLYQNNLVALFAPGYFACYQLPNLTRNLALEQQLNTRRFTYHWVLDGQLVAATAGRYVAFSEGQWNPYATSVPLSRQSKLLEDDQYIACMKCNGEWGGEAYFYNKQQRTYYLALATCPVAIIKQSSGYLVLSSLNHLGASSSLQFISSPSSELTRWLGKTKPQERDLAHRYDAPLSHGRTVFKYFDLLILSGFKLNNELLFLVSWRNTTFLATWKNGVFLVVDPLFHTAIMANEPITTAYGPNTALVSLSDAQVAETSCLLFHNQQAIEVSWNPADASMAYSTAPLRIALNIGYQAVDSVEVQIVE